MDKMKVGVVAPFTTIVLSGGGILGSIHLGFLSCLRERKLLLPRRIIGTSVGSMIGLFLACGIPEKIVFDHFCRMDTRLIKLGNLTDLFDTFGIDDGEYFWAHVADLLVQYNLNPRMTFRNLYSKFNIEFVVCVVNIITQSVEYLSLCSTPDMPVVDAVRASCSVPFLVKPVREQNGSRVYVDGSVMANYPFAYLGDNVSSHVIGCNIASWKPRDSINDLSSFLYSILGCVFSAGSSRGWPNTVEIDCSNVSYFDFDKSFTERTALFKLGYDNTMAYLDDGSIGETTTTTTRIKHKRSLSI